MLHGLEEQPAAGYAITQIALLSLDGLRESLWGCLDFEGYRHGFCRHKDIGSPTPAAGFHGGLGSNLCTSVADLLLDEQVTTVQIQQDIESAPVSEKMKALLHLAGQVQQGGKAVTEDVITRARKAGANDPEIHDTVLIASLFCLYNRYVDGLATVTPDNPAFYSRLAERIRHGYKRPAQGYDHLKNNPA